MLEHQSAWGTQATGVGRRHHNQCMQRLAETCERIGATTKKTEKVALLADYFRSCSLDEAAASAVFLSGRAFPSWEQATLGVGGTQLWRAVVEIADTTDTELTRAYRRYGDLGSA